MAELVQPPVHRHQQGRLMCCNGAQIELFKAIACCRGVDMHSRMPAISIMVSLMSGHAGSPGSRPWGDQPECHSPMLLL